MTDKITLLSDSDHEYTENTEDSKQSEEEKKTNTSTKIKPKIKSKNNMIHVVGISFDNIKLTMPENTDQKTPSLFLCTFPRQYIGPLPQEFQCDTNNGGFCYFSKEIENIYQLTGCNLDCILLSPGEHLDCVQILLNDTILIALMTDVNRDKNLFQGKIDEIKIDKFKGDFGPWPENMSLSGEMNIYSNTFAIEEYKNSLKYYNGCLKPEISKTVLMDKSKTSVFFDINNLQYATADKSENPWLRLYTLQSTNDSYCNVKEIGTNKYQCMESNNESYHTFELQHEIDSKQNDDQQYLAVIELPENFDKETWVAESPLWWISFKDIENMRDIKLFRGYYSSYWVKKADEFEIEWCGNNKVINIWKDEWTVNNLNINVLLSKENLKDITTINEEWKEQHYHVQQKVVLLLFTSKTKDISSKIMKFCVKWTHSAYGKINRYEKWCNRNKEVFLEINRYLHSSNLSEVDIPDSILDDLIKPEFNADINEIYLLNNLVCEGIDLYYNEYYENGFYFLLKEWKNKKLNGVQYSGKNMSLTLKLLVRKLLLENLLNGQDEEFNIFRSYYIAKTPTKFAFAVLSLIVSFLFSIALSWDVYNEFELDNISDDALILILSIFIFFIFYF
eukprot:489584_1